MAGDGRAAARRGALRELRDAAPGSEQQLAWARFFASVASEEADLAVLRGLLEGTEKIDGLDVDQELRWVFLAPLAAHGAADEGVLAAELARDDTAGSQAAPGALPGLAALRRGQGAGLVVAQSDKLSNALVEGYYRRLRAALAAGAARAVHREVLRGDRAGVGRAVHPDRDGRGPGPSPSLRDSQETLDATDAWLSAHEDAAPALRRLVLEARDDRRGPCGRRLVTGPAAGGERWGSA
ncbi:aminopeptidase N [Streptomyces violaceorubidus]